MDKNNEKDLWVVKSNHFVEKAAYYLSINQQRVINRLIAGIDPQNDETFKRHGFKISDFYKWLNLSGQSQAKRRKTLVDVLTSLQQKVIEIKIPSPAHGGEMLITPAFIEMPIYDWDKNFVSLKVFKGLKPFFLGLEKFFTPALLAELDSFKCAYSGRFLEICINRQPRSDYHDRIIDGFYVKDDCWELPRLKRHLGIAENKYQQPRYFRKRVLEAAQREINQKTTSRFDFEMIKKGRSVAGVRLLIFGVQVSLERPGCVTPVQSVEASTLQQSLTDFGVSESFQDVLCSSKYDDDQVWKALAAVEEWQAHRRQSGDTIKNKDEAVRLALVENWKPKGKKWLKDARKQAKIEEKRPKKVLSYEERKEINESQFHKAHELSEKIDFVMNSLPDKEIEKLTQKLNFDLRKLILHELMVERRYDFNDLLSFTLKKLTQGDFSVPLE